MKLKKFYTGVAALEVRGQIDLQHENLAFWPEKRTCITEKVIMNRSMIFQAKTSTPLLKVFQRGEGGLAVKSIPCQIIPCNCNRFLMSFNLNSDLL